MDEGTVVLMEIPCAEKQPVKTNCLHRGLKIKTINLQKQYCLQKHLDFLPEHVGAFLPAKPMNSVSEREPPPRKPAAAGPGSGKVRARLPGVNHGVKEPPNRVLFVPVSIKNADCSHSAGSHRHS